MTFPDTQMSPDGRIRVEWQVTEWRMSHSSRAPRLTETGTDRLLLDLWGDDWDASLTWLDAGVVQLDLRRYTQEGHCTVLIDAHAGQWRIGNASAPPQPLETVKHGLEQVFAAANRATPKPSWWTDPEPVIVPQTIGYFEQRELVVGPFVLPFGILVFGYTILAALNPDYRDAYLGGTAYQEFGVARVTMFGLAMGVALIIGGLYALRRALWTWRRSRPRPR